ncbi:MAG: lysophospholipid acyltransferase family protein, partial [Aridibacter sp.]
VLNIYPEGERAFDGDLHPFKKGAAILATELNLPIVPVALDGLHKVWARESNKIRLAKVKVKFGKPFYANEIVDSEMNEEQQYEVITQELKRKIQVMLDEMRR